MSQEDLMDTGPLPQSVVQLILPKDHSGALEPSHYGRNEFMNKCIVSGFVFFFYVAKGSAGLNPGLFAC